MTVALAWTLVLLAVSGFLAFLAVGANEPADPRLATVRPVSGFAEIAFRVTPGDGLPSATERCALLAETPEQLQRGMMGRRDLGGYDAMIFRFAQDSTGTFYMRNVPIALSIAWFDAGGRFVSSADMAPCPDMEGCPQYSASGPYRYALEVPKGGLARLGIEAGSVLRAGGSCSS